MIRSLSVLRAPGLALVVLVLPPTLSLGGSVVLESEARALGGRLGAALTSLVLSAADAPGTDGDLPDVVSSAGDDLGAGALDADVAPTAPDPNGPRSLAASSGDGARDHRPRQGTSRHGLHVDASTVLRLASRRVVPTGRPVAAVGGRPAGIELSSVSALGVGVRDGDVLTEVAGSPVHTEGQVVGAVLGCRARRLAAVSAVFYRGRERWSLVVEMPYPPGS